MSTQLLKLWLIARSLLPVFETTGDPMILAGYRQSEETGPHAEYVRRVMLDFIDVRYRQMHESAVETPFDIHPDFERLFELMRTGTTDAVFEVYDRIRSGIEQYEDAVVDPELNTPAWPYVWEAFGAWEQWVGWSPTLLRMYADDILDSIPDRSIYFGGTDSGRFVVTVFNEMVATNRVVVLTQNALANNLYMDYVRRYHGGRIVLPDRADGAIRKYVEEVRSGLHPRSASISVDGSRVSVQGVQGVMIINGILARMIFERNRDDYTFFVEESYVVEWMYPYLTPHGLIMKLNAESLAYLPDDVVEQDMQFWDLYVRRLTSNPHFLRDDVARKFYSKLRSAIAGLYAYRGMNEKAEHAFREALILYPLSPEASFRLADLYLRQSRPHDAIELMEGFHEKVPDNDRALPFIAQIRQRVMLNEQRQELEQRLQSGTARFEDATQLAEIYNQLGNQQAYTAIIRNLVDDPGVPPSVIRELAGSLRQREMFEQAEHALMRYLERIPADHGALLELAETRIRLRKLDEALRSLDMAVRIEPGLRDELRNDSRFELLRNHPGFRQLMEMP